MASKADKPHLVIIEGKEKGKVIELKDGTVIFGRSKGDVLVQDPRVSRSHLAVHFDEKTKQVSFNDLKSLNGTFVNGGAASTGELSDGDKIQIGDTVFDCQIKDANGQSAQAQADDLPSGPNITFVSEHGVDPEKSQASQVRSEPIEPTPMESRIEPAMADEPKRETVAREKSTKTKATKKKKEKKTKKSLFALLRKKKKSKTEPSAEQESEAAPPKRKSRVAALCLAFLLMMGVYYLLDSAPSAGQLDKQIGQIETLIESGELIEAVSQARMLVEKHPKSAEPYLLLGDIFAILRKYESAAQAYEGAKATEQAPALVHIKLIRVYLRANMEDKARKELASIDKIVSVTVKRYVKLIKTQNKSPQEILDENPEILDLLLETGKLFVEFNDRLQEDWDSEKSLIIAKGLQKNIAQDNPVGYLLEAQIYFDRQNFQAANQLLGEAASRASKEPWAYEHIANLQFAIGDYDASLQTLTEWKQVQPTSESLAFINNKLEAYKLIQSSQGVTDPNELPTLMSRILEYLNEAAKYDPKDEWIFEQRALVKLRLVDMMGASTVVNKWLELYPDSSKALTIMAYIKLHERKPEEALPLISKVINMSKGGDTRFFPDAVYLYGKVQEQQQNFDEARKYVKQSCDLGYQRGCQDPLISERVPGSAPPDALPRGEAASGQPSAEPTPAEEKQAQPVPPPSQKAPASAPPSVPPNQ